MRTYLQRVCFSRSPKNPPITHIKLFLTALLALWLMQGCDSSSTHQSVNPRKTLSWDLSTTQAITQIKWPTDKTSHSTWAIDGPTDISIKLPEELSISMPCNGISVYQVDGNVQEINLGIIDSVDGNRNAIDVEALILDLIRQLGTLSDESPDNFKTRVSAWKASNGGKPKDPLTVKAGNSEATVHLTLSMWPPDESDPFEKLEARITFR